MYEKMTDKQKSEYIRFINTIAELIQKYSVKFQIKK